MKYVNDPGLKLGEEDIPPFEEINDKSRH